MKLEGLPALSEIDEESDSDCVLVQEESQSEWGCHACTFINHGLLSSCEMCGAPKRTANHIEKNSHGCNEDAAAAFAGLSPAGNWPALPQQDAESWIDCDVSSVASSWLDIGDATEHFDNVDGVVVDAATPEVVQPSRPAGPLWSSIVGSKAAVAPTPAIAGVIIPPIVKRKARAKIIKEEDEEDRDVDLDELEARRMLGTQSHRHGSRRQARKRIAVQ